MTVGIAVLTLNAAKDLPTLLPLIMAEPGPIKILVVDSASTDGTADWVARQSSVELCSITRSEFNHGATRELARKRLGTDIVVLLTQDVIPQPGWLTLLIKPLVDGQAAVAYARQLPHSGADMFEAFPREFNYPADPQMRTLTDASTHGVYTFFCSDSCAAYLNRALDEVGGFQPTLTNEDYFAVARLLRAGGTIAYAAKATVKHSHRYSLGEEFSRYFDTGYVRAENLWVTEIVGQAELRGSAMASSFLRRLLHEAPWLIPYGMLQLGAKWIGYRLGYLSYSWSRKWCCRLSSQKYYWTSPHCRHPKA